MAGGQYLGTITTIPAARLAHIENTWIKLKHALNIAQL